MVELIEEMVEIKVRQYASASSKNPHMVNRDLARVMFEANAADRGRMNEIKQALVQILESC